MRETWKGILFVYVFPFFIIHVVPVVNIWGQNIGEMKRGAKSLLTELKDQLHLNEFITSEN